MTDFSSLHEQFLEWYNTFCRPAFSEGLVLGLLLGSGLTVLLARMTR